jgi:TolB-like protein
MAETRTRRRLAAVLAADVVGYSRLMENDEAGTLAALKARRQDLLVPLVARHGGRVVKVMGDGVLVEFGSAVDAVQCAVTLQEKFTAANQGISEAQRIVLRIGINLGDIIVEGSDLYGDGVNVAARLEGLAEPGGTYVSATVHDHVLGKLALPFDDLGEHTLKNIAKPVRIYRVQPGSTGIAQPALELPDKPSIAVLPFQNMSGDPEQEYFADGIVEEIITALSRVRWLFVIARNSSFTYKGRAVNVKQIGRELGVRYVLEGSVRKAANRIRITGQLIDATTDAHLWADRFEGGLEEVFDLQDRVTSSVVGAISPRLEQAEIERSRRKPTENLDAYDYYLRGLAQVHQYSKKANTEALRLFSRALELDPQYAVAYGLAARCYAQRKTGGWIEDHIAAAAEAERLARRAVELGKDDAIALCTAGIGLADVAGDLEGGAELIEKSLVLNPNLAIAWFFSGWLKVSLGEPDIGIERMSCAMRLSPQDPQVFSMQLGLGYAHFVAERYEEALSWSEKAVREQPGFIFTTCIAAASAALLGRQSQSQKFMTIIRRLEPTLSLSTLGDLIVMRRQADLERFADGLRKAGLPE